MIVTIDGPSGAGKSTLAKRVAKEFGLTYLDTGAMYRALAVKLLRLGLDLADGEGLTKLVGSTEIDLAERNGRVEVLLDGEEVSDLIRTPEVSQMASRASALQVVRKRMLELQRALGRRGNVVAEGRDIGTVVLPDADLKMYLDASIGERARRRHAEFSHQGRAVTEQIVLEDLRRRDQIDSERTVSPLRPADDAIIIETDGLSQQEVLRRALQLVDGAS